MATAALRPTSKDAASTSPALSLPRATFAKISPRPFFLAHLQPESASSPIVRPNGRYTEESREPAIHRGSLSHANGSAVVRIGNTALVCGVRAEILMANDVSSRRGEDISSSRPSQNSASDQDELRELGLLVPNVELSTGCSPSHLPGQPPSLLAQTLSARLLSLLYSSALLSPQDLQIWYELPASGQGESPTRELVAYWTLYIDVLFISYDGNAFDSVWIAIVAALFDTKLPHASWDIDQELVVCHQDTSLARSLRLRSIPIASTFLVFAKGSGGIRGGGPSSNERVAWLLADPDEFEESLCTESITVVLDHSSQEDQEIPRNPTLLKLEKNGGASIGPDEIRGVVSISTRNGRIWQEALLS